MIGVSALGSIVCNCLAKEEGQVNSFRFAHVENASFPIEVTLSGMLMLVRLLHSLNAPPPMVVTLSGMLMLVRLSCRPSSPAPVRKPHFDHKSSG